MKKYEAILCTLAFVFSLGCFAQSTNSVSASPAPGKTTLLTDSLPTNDMVIQSYYVEERINKLFGGRIITYQVSKLDLVDTYDLGPNNTRTVIPNYVKRKPKVAPNAIEAKTLVASSSASLAPVKVEVVTPASSTSKYVTVNMVDTYEKVIDKGYKSIEMLKKVADRFYFEGNLTAAAGYYTQLFDQAKDLDVIYYYRYAQSLKAINEDEKANTLMKRFKSETLTMK
ncbi:MAG: hypothetical protein REI96_02940 [Flavobacterium nitrogenifigens]|uniref:hypothetical protein n=1 Tax=Flavobacterium nitrogenifigens TaxID=1617283 RepID=UPI0028080861|nr:hypothetical protein [Flavobacterium nitrogenifigens]MDQ8011380.1 hypothetical protein [Flavobacterium nitrogenifigens]